MAIQRKVVREVPHKSGFDKSFRNLLTAPVGTLVPVLVDEVIPGSNVHLKALVSGSMAPLATDTFMNVEYRMEAFFVPYRILYRGFEDWLTQNENVYLDDISKSAVPTLPAYVIHNSDGGFVENVAAGSLLDYLGYKDVSEQYERDFSQRINIFPMLAYHKVWSDHYRNALVQKDCFAKPFVTTGYDLANADYLAAALPYIAFDPAFTSLPAISEYEYDTDNNSYVATNQATLADGVKLSELRQRNFDNDYFTMAQPTAQQGDEQKIEFSTSGSTGSFTIGQLRMANSLQQFAELNSLAGPRMVDYVKAHYGANLSDGVSQRSIYLGRSKMTIYSKGIYQTAKPLSEPLNQTLPNPFNTVGSQYGSPYFADDSTLIDNFEVNEPGVIMVLGSIVPRVTYSSGIARYLTHHYTSDAQRVNIADPLLQNVGNQPIYKSELDALADNTVFGYIDRFAEWMSAPLDQVHGLIRDGETLDSFALQRSFNNGSRPVISSEFLQIPKNFMNQVFAWSQDSDVRPAYGNFGAWIDHFFQYKVAMPLAEYSLPTLQDPSYEHGKKVVVDRSGSHL